MTLPDNCKQNADTFKLIRSGTTQEQRLLPALKPVSAPVDERIPAHDMVFAQAYAAYLKYYNLQNIVSGDWQPFFSSDVSVLLAIAAVADVDYYRQQVREYANFLDDRHNLTKDDELRDHLDFLFSCSATLAIRLNHLLELLPAEIPLKGLLKNLVQSQLATALGRLIAYHSGGETLTPRPINDSSSEKTAPINILGGPAVKFSALAKANLSKVWTDGTDWHTYYNSIAADASVYGTPPGLTVFDLVNHLTTHNLFTSILDQFLKAYAKIVIRAKLDLDATFTSYNRHEPPYALFLAFLRLFTYARTELNTLTARHLDFYYREILRLKEKPSLPSKAHLLVELAKQAPTHLIPEGKLFKAGKDDLGHEAFFGSDRDFVANQAKVAALKTLYRHGEEKEGLISPTDIDQGRLYASPVANSADGLGAALTSADQSWHPFYNKNYQDGQLVKINMPKAEIGFAVTSHYFFLAEGDRTVRLQITYSGSLSGDYTNGITCLFTTAKGWLERAPEKFTVDSILKLETKLSGDDPAITPYDPKVHGYNFATNLPLLIVKLKHTDSHYIYSIFQDIEIKNISFTVEVSGLRTLAVSNDFGQIDISKPFLPFGASPIDKNSFIIGSKEIFQKQLDFFHLDINWQVKAVSYPKAITLPVATSVTSFFDDNRTKVHDFEDTRIDVPDFSGIVVSNTISPLKDSILPGIKATWLNNGKWNNEEAVTSFFYDNGTEVYKFEDTIVDLPDFSENVVYNTNSTNGYLRLTLDQDFGQAAYQDALRDYLIGQTKTPATGTKPEPVPAIPIIESIYVNYGATQDLDLSSSSPDSYATRQARFFHLAPFGQTEQHPYLNTAHKVYLLPQFDFFSDNAKQESEAEFYIGISGLVPPQNLAVLFQVADGTANPLANKPEQHLHWSYLADNEWVAFASNEVEDQTGGLLNSGIITFAMAREATADNSLLPSGMHWIRAAVASASDAICRLQQVLAQALAATFVDKGNDPAFSAKVLSPGTISKLDQPDAAVKKISQPFPTFGGRGQETSTAFYTRVSERLRHKDRAISLWDYERLVLEAFPEIYQVKCLNHTQYEPEGGIYRELASGHVTIVTIPSQQSQIQRNPLQPFTSLGLLEKINDFLVSRLSCFVKLHVKNPLFEEVRVAFKVRLAPGRDESFYLNKLQEDITRFLSPWAFSGGSSPSFGGKIYKSVVINFVEELPYIDFVTDMQLFHTFLDAASVQQTVEKIEVDGSRAVSILVSAPKHTIVPLKPAAAVTSGEKCPCEA